MVEQIILNCISDGVLTIDLNGKINYVNRAMQELLGYPESALIGKKGVRSCNNTL